MKFLNGVLLEGTGDGITLDTSNFSTNLSSADDTVQKAMETLDALAAGSSNPLEVGTDDDTAGVITIYSDGASSTQGGKIVLTIAPDHDTNYQTYSIDVSSPDLFIYGNGAAYGAVSLIRYNGTTNRLFFGEGNGTVGAINVWVGALDASNEQLRSGTINVVGAPTGSDQGGAVILYTAEDHDTSNIGFVLQANQDDFTIGPATDQDVLKLDSNKDLYLTAGSLVLPASEYVNLGGTQGSGGYGFRDNSGVIEKKSSGFDWNPVHGYVERGDPSSHDVTQATLTMDNAFYDLDLSGIVPAGAVMIKLRVIVSDNNIGTNLVFRKNGITNAIASRGVYTQGSSQVVEQEIDVACDSGRVIEYRASEAIATANITVLGWWI